MKQLLLFFLGFTMTCAFIAIPRNAKITIAAGLTAAAIVGAIIFWGPSQSSGSDRGRLAGLVKLGKTCFLNALLHALAACLSFITWLKKDKFVKDTSPRSTLATVLSVINGTNKSVQESYGSAAVITALERLGWIIPAENNESPTFNQNVRNTTVAGAGTNAVIDPPPNPCPACQARDMNGMCREIVNGCVKLYKV